MMKPNQSLSESDLSRLALLSILEDEKLAREELQKSEERLRLSTELARVAVWEYDFRTNRMSRSRNHDQLYGLEWHYTWDLNTFNDAIHPEDRDFSNQMIQQSVSPGGPNEYTFDFRVVHPNQSLHWLSVVGQVVERNTKGEGIIVRGCLIDITDRKKAEQSMLESETRYRTLFDNSMDAVLLTAPDGKILDVNKATCEMFGWTAEEIHEMGRNGLADLDDPRLAVALRERERKGFTQAEITMIRANGEKFPAEITSTIFTDAEGNQRTSMIIRDITQRKQLELDREWALKLFSTIFSRSPVATALTKLPERTIMGLNKACEEMFGYSKDEMAGKSATDFRIWKDLQLQQEIFEQVRKTGVVKNIEFEYVRKSGEAGTGTFYAEMIEHRGERYLILKFIDVTARKLAEEKFSKTFRLSPDIIILTSLKDGLIVDANENAFAITGYGPEELLGRKTTELDIWVDPEERDRYIALLGKEGKVHNFETGFRMRSGEIRTGLISGEIIEIGGDKFILGVIRDITERKEAERLLRITMNRLIETEEQLRREAAQQLHDQVGQNLTALIINLNFIRNQLSTESLQKTGKQVADSLLLLEDTVDRTRDIMTDLRPSILDDYGLFAALSASAEKFSDRFHIPVKLTGKDLSKKLAPGSEYALYRMAQELLHNVVKHAQATQVKLDLSEYKGTVRLTLRDDGRGFDPVVVAQRKEEKGFGLTAITERMKSLGGTCQIQSAPGEGTTVVLEIRRTKDEGRETSEVRSKKEEVRRKKEEGRGKKKGYFSSFVFVSI